MELALLAAGATFVAITALLGAVFAPSASQRVEKRLGQLSDPVLERSPDNVLRTDTGTFPLLRRLLTGNAWAEGARKDLAQAGWGLKVSEYFLLRLVLAVVPAAMAVVMSPGSPLGLLFAAACAVIGFMAPALALKFFRARRQEKINKQLPEMLALISNSLRSGFAFVQSIELAAKQIDAPMSVELQQLLNDVSLGAPTDVALQGLAERTGSYDLEMMVATVLIQRSTGGNLSEILDNVAETVRERERLNGEIRALTASQRFTGTVLSVYPILLGLLFFTLAPDIWVVLLEKELGRILLLSAGVLQVIGIVAIRRILKLEV